MNKLQLVVQKSIGGSVLTERSPAVLAQDSIEELSAADDTFIPDQEGPPILSTAEQEYISLCSTEKELVQALMPILERVCSDNRVAVSSEDFPFLFVRSNNMQKPDIVIGAPAFFIKKTPSHGLQDESKSCAVTDQRYAVPHPSLLDSVHFVDAKLTCTNKALGELLIHLSLQGDRTKKAHRGVLVSKKEFWAVEVEHKQLLYRHRGKWTSPGTYKFLQDFLSAPPYATITHLCASAGYEPIDSHTFRSLGCSFLGEGAHGRVFAVVPSIVGSQAARVHHVVAAKAVLLHNHTALVKEWARLRQHADSCECSLLVRPLTGVVSNDFLSCFVMKPAGLHPVNRASLLVSGDRGLNAVKRVVMALIDLHTHTGQAIYHGDARLANLIELKDKSLCWVDLRDATVGCEPDVFPALVKHDCITLFRSIFGLEPTEALPDKLLMLVDQYAMNPDIQYCDLLSNEVRLHLVQLNV